MESGSDGRSHSIIHHGGTAIVGTGLQDDAGKSVGGAHFTAIRDDQGNWAIHETTDLKGAQDVSVHGWGGITEKVQGTSQEQGGPTEEHALTQSGGPEVSGVRDVSLPRQTSRFEAVKNEDGTFEIREITTVNGQQIEGWSGTTEQVEGTSQEPGRPAEEHALQ